MNKASFQIVRVLIGLTLAPILILGFVWSFITFAFDLGGEISEDFRSATKW